MQINEYNSKFMQIIVFDIKINPIFALRDIKNLCTDIGSNIPKVILLKIIV